MRNINEIIQSIEDAFDLIHSDFIGTDDFNEEEWKQEKQDAISVLKMQQEEIKELKSFINGFSKHAIVPVRCKDCKNFIWNSISQNAGSCGIGIGDGRQNWHSKDWFCANGVKTDDL